MLVLSVVPYAGNNFKPEEKRTSCDNDYWLLECSDWGWECMGADVLGFSLGQQHPRVLVLTHSHAKITSARLIKV